MAQSDASIGTLHPDMVRRLGRAEMKARTVVEGFLAGLHNSPYRGFSVEFAEHRPYVPGDDPRHIDWKVYGKRERYYIKQYHEETNFVATILLDASRSMVYGSGEQSKLEYAGLLAAALSYVVLRQHDAASLGVFDRANAGYVPPGTGLNFLTRLSRALSRVEPKGTSDIGGALTRLADQIGRGLGMGTTARRGIVVVISDFFDDPQAILTGLRNLRSRGHEVIACHIMDTHELEFPMQGHVRFEGLEMDLRVSAEPHRIREDYIAVVNEHLHALRQGCSRAGIDYRLGSTAMPLDEFLLSYLATREKKRRVSE